MDFVGRALRNYDRRKSAERKASCCDNCGSSQVQLISWLSDDIKFKCRKCKTSWIIHDKWDDSF